jgi:hypothetical protein
MKSMRGEIEKNVGLIGLNLSAKRQAMAGVSVLSGEKAVTQYD